MPKNFYEILRISPGADRDEVRSSYRRLARRYHPDAGVESSGDQFRAIREAYEVLGDPERRDAYDRLRQKSERAPIPIRRSSYSTPRPRGFEPEAAEHLDLSGLFDRPRAEPLRARPRVAGFSPEEQLFAFLRSFDRLFH